jgi:hypothetical protein
MGGNAELWSSIFDNFTPILGYIYNLKLTKIEISYLLTPGSRALLEKLTDSQLV